jgi:uncharacterized protein YegL
MMNEPLFQVTRVPAFAVAPQPARRPHDVVIYATRGGDLHVLDGGKPLSWRDSMFSQYALRYEVHMADYQRTVRLGQSPPPSAEGIYTFDVTLDVGFRVRDPLEVIRRRVVDPLPLLYGHLIHACHEVTGRFSIEQPGLAQAALQQRFMGEEVIEGCLVLYKCRVRLAPERAYYRHHRDRAEALMTIDDRAAEQKLAMAEAGNQINLELLNQQGKLLKADNERSALAGRPMDVRELIAMGIERGELSNRDAIDRMLQLEQLQAAGAAEVQDRFDARVKVLAEQNLLGKAEAASLLNPPAAAVDSRPATPAVARPPAWDDPLPGGPAAPRALIPVYLVLHQSIADHLGAGLQAVLDALAERPDIAAAVRLAVLGYADGVDAPLAMQAVRSGLRLPPFTASAGSRYGAVFERLLDCVPRDTAALKAQAAAVCRPQVMFLSGAQPDDEPAWTVPYGRLVDRGTHPGAPDIIACGVGGVSPATIAGVATRPELAFVAEPGNVGAAVQRFCAFAQRHIIGYGRAILDGEVGPVVAPPDGYRLARELS